MNCVGLMLSSFRSPVAARLSIPEDRFALFHEGPHPFFTVFGPCGSFHRIGMLMTQVLMHGFEDAFGQSHRLRGVRAESFQPDAELFLQILRILRQRGDQSPVQCLLGSNGSTREGHMARPRHSHHLR